MPGYVLGTEETKRVDICQKFPGIHCLDAGRREQALCLKAAGHLTQGDRQVLWLEGPLETKASCVLMSPMESSSLNLEEDLCRH